MTTIMVPPSLVAERERPAYIAFLETLGVDWQKLDREWGADVLAQAEAEQKAGEWDEEAHPRGPDGRFIEGGGDMAVSQDGTVPVHIRTIDEAIRVLGKGRGVMFTRPEHAVTLLNKLATMAQEARASNQKAPVYDLCKVSVAGTNLFCADNVGIPRSEMPQLRGQPTPGTPADSLPKDANGEVDLGPSFIDFVRAQGHDVETTSEYAGRLRASQTEMDGKKVGGMMVAMAEGKIKPAPIFISKDNYVIDGHHRWAAIVGNSLQEQIDMHMAVTRVDLPVLDTLALANSYAAGMGIPQRAVGKALTAYAWALALYALHQKEWDEALHPRDEAGRFTSDGGGESDYGAGTLWGSALPRTNAEIANEERIARGGARYMTPAENFQQTVENRFEDYLRQAGKTDDEIDGVKASVTNDLQTMLADKHVFVAVDTGVLLRVLDSGRFESQFESSHSNGLFDPSERANAEGDLFDFPPDGPVVERPIYGYVGRDEDGRDGGDVAQYGDVRLRLNDSVRADTTITYGDSLNFALDKTGCPTPLTNPGWQSVESYHALQADKGEASIGWNSDPGDDYPRGPSQVLYVEAQIHGGVTAKVIASALFNAEPDQAVKDRLDAEGIPWKVADEGWSSW